jgi:flagellin
MLLSALTLRQDLALAGSTISGESNDDETATWSAVKVLERGDDDDNPTREAGTTEWVTLANDNLNDTLSLEMISVGVLAKALENVAFLRAQNGGATSRLSFNADSLAVQTTNLRAAHGRIVDVDIAEESTNLAKYSILTQASASMLSQANLSSDVALMLLR